MRSLLALSIVGLLSVCLAACGGSKGTDASSRASTAVKEVTVSTTPTYAPPAPVKAKADADHDNDIGAADDDTNNNSVLDYGHAADASDARTITSLIKRYYAAALAEDGAKACSMLYSTLEESVPEDYGQSPPSQPYLRGTTCAAVLRLLFKHNHPQLAVEYPKLDVARVRLMEHHAIVILHFGAMPERQISVAREGHTWKIEMLLDSEVP
jgi:hypothetical protein